MKYISLFISVLVLVFSISNIANAKTQKQIFDVQGTGEIVWVTDGDTFKIEPDNSSVINKLSNGVSQKGMDNYKYGQFVVRLANVDTAESVHYNKSRNSKEGKKVSNLMKDKLYGKRVEFRCFNRGHYERAICNVSILGNSEIEDIGAYLIKNGYSKYVTSWGRNPYKDSQYSSF